MRDLIMQSTSMEVEKRPYTVQLLLEEVTSLRKRVKELEDDGSKGSSRTAPLSESHDSIDNQDVAVLRKHLMKEQHERAELEKDFMNQLAILAQENHKNIEKLQKQLRMAECEKNIIKANGSFEQSEEIYELEQEVEQLKEVIAAQGDEGVQQLVQKLSANEKELNHVKEDNKGLREKINDLDNQKTTLLEEITHLRIDYDKESKAVMHLRSEMEEMEKEYNLQLEKFQNDFMAQEDAIERHEESFGEMHDNIVELEGQKAVLLDEITGLRLKLDQEQDTRAEMKRRIEELTAITMEAGDYKVVAMEKRASASEDNASKLSESINDLQNELRSLTGSYNSDMARLEERLSSRDKQIEELKIVIEKKEQELKETGVKTLSAQEELKTLKRELEKQNQDAAEKEHEIASMVSQRISYEKRATQNIMDHVAEVDDLRSKVVELQDEVDFLKKRLHEEKQRSFEICAGSLRETAPPTPPRRPSSTRSTPHKSYQFSRTHPPAPPLPVTPTRSSWTRAQLDKDTMAQRVHVRDIAARFEKSITSNSSHGPSKNNDHVPMDESDISMSSAEGEELDCRVSESQLVRELHEKLQKQSELIGELRAEIATLTATRGAQAIMMEKDYTHKIRDCEDKIASLTKELEETRCNLESETELVHALREELNILAIEKVSYVENGCTPEEQKAHTVQMNQMANALTAAQMEKANMERELKKQIKELEDTIESMNTEIDEELDEKQEEIVALQREVETQLENVKRLEKEREQICTNINSVSNAKKVEIDELHEELMAKTAKTHEQEREIDSLAAQVEKQKEASNELGILRARVHELEKGTNLFAVNIRELEDLRVEKQKMSDSLRKMGMERRALQEKLAVVMSEKSASKSLQVLRERNEVLKKEVERLTRRVRQAEKGGSRIEI